MTLIIYECLLFRAAVRCKVQIIVSIMFLFQESAVHPTVQPAAVQPAAVQPAAVHHTNIHLWAWSKVSVELNERCRCRVYLILALGCSGVGGRT